MPSSKVFTYNGLAVHVGCVDPAQLAWLEEFLVPAFRPDAAAAADCTVTLEVDRPRYTGMLREGPHPNGGRVAGFAFDGGPVEMPVWKSRDDDRVVFDADSEVFYCISRDGAHVRILSAKSHLSRRISLMRVVRELAMSDSWSSGRFVLHAGACALADSGIIIAGPKGAGKTTLLMHVLGCRGTRFIANDRVVVSCNGQPPLVRGMPTVVSIRQQTLRGFAAFEQRWLRSHYRERVALHEVNTEDVSSKGTDPITLTPAQFCALLGVPPVGEAPARLLLFPRMTDDIDGLRVEELSPESARRRLAASVFAAGSPCKASQVLALAGHCSPPDPAAVNRLSPALVEQVRSFDCLLGRPAPRTSEGVEAFLARHVPAPATTRFSTSASEPRS